MIRQEKELLDFIEKKREELNYPSGKLLINNCDCGNNLFELFHNELDYSIDCKCTECSDTHFLCGDENYHGNRNFTCECGGTEYLIGYSLYKEYYPAVIIGLQCVKCGNKIVDMYWNLERQVNQ